MSVGTSVWVSGIDLWDPTHVSGVAAVCVTAFLLGIVHGVTPDEHTWPITFSYAVGSYSTRRGLRAGLTFSAAFTVQRAALSELAFLGLAGLFTIGWVDNVVYVLVGALMAAGGVLIAGGRDALHVHLPGRRRRRGSGVAGRDGWLQDPRWWMPAVHGFVAGFGFGAFALIIYTVLAPAMPAAVWGWVPGALFGAGTAVVQAAGGAAFGRVVARRGVGADGVRRIGLATAARTLAWGGVAFAAAGVFGLVFPKLASFSVDTGIRVHNLDQIGLPLILVVAVVAGVGGTTLVRALHAETRRRQPA